MQKILVVDDESYFRGLFKILLEDDYQIIVASNGEQALELIQQEDPDLVLMDVLMSGMNGYEVCEWMKGQEKYHDTPLIFLTVKGSPEEEAKGFSLGAVDYIAKPISPPIVKARVKTQMELQNARKKLRNHVVALEEMVAQRTTDLVAEIEERKAIENALRLQQLELRQTLDSLLVGIISIDETGKVLSFNHFAEVIFGYNAEEVIGQSFCLLFSNVVPLENNFSIEGFLEGAELNAQNTSGRQVYAMRKNNEVFPMQMLLAELPMGNDGKRRLIGSFFDMTVLKQQEDQLHRLQKNEALSALSSGIVHDYNNVLGLILGYTEILSTQLHGHSDLIAYVDEINKAAERGSKLAGKILSFSNQKIKAEEKVNINTVLLDQQFMLEKMLGHRIRFELEMAEDIWYTYLNKGELEDAILNFSTNALHAMLEEGRLTFATKNVTLNDEEAILSGVQAGKYVQLSISDTGPGMSEETQAKIFDPFFSTKGESGSGLGLAQVYRFVQRSNGGISVASILGEGTYFKLLFPCYNPD